MRNGKLFDKKEWKKSLQYVKQKPYTTQSVLTREDGKIITNHHEYIKETIKCIEKATQQKLYKTKPKGIEIPENMIEKVVNGMIDQWQNVDPGKS